MNRPSINRWKPGAMRSRPSIMRKPSMLGMTTTLASVPSLSTRCKAFDPCCVRGSALIGVFHKRRCRFTSVSWSSCTLFGGAASRRWLPCALYSSLLDSPIEPSHFNSSSAPVLTPYGPKTISATMDNTCANQVADWKSGEGMLALALQSPAKCLDASAENEETY